MKKSTSLLVADLKEAGASAVLMRRATAGHFHDFDSQSVTPTLDLMSAAKDEELTMIVENVRLGKYNAAYDRDS